MMQLNCHPASHTPVSVSAAARLAQRSLRRGSLLHAPGIATTITTTTTHSSRHSSSSRARAASSTPARAAAASADEAAVIVDIPASREEAVSAAVAALLGQVQGPTTGSGRSSKRNKRKGFSGSTSTTTSATSSTAAPTRFSIELPLPTQSPADAVALAADVLARLPPAVAGAACVVFACDEAAGAAASSSSSGLKRAARVCSLASACRASGTLGGPLLLVEPGVADVALVEQLLEEAWQGPWAAVLNPGWFSADAAAVPQPYQALVASWEAAYSLTITATQGLMRTEGAVLRQLPPASASSGQAGGDEEGGLWRVLLKDARSGQFMQVGQLRRRPSPSDLEVAFINAKAATSPLTTLVRGARGLWDAATSKRQ